MAKRTLTIGDLHLPFVHPKYLRFCQDMAAKYDAERIVFIGDVVDWHSVSYHEVDPDGLSAGDEMKLTRRMLKRWVAAFPKADVCIGNHDARLHRKMMTHGMPAGALRSYKDLWETPGWNWGEEFVHDGVKYTHGTGLSGQTAALYRAMRNRISVVIGHTHSFGGVQYHASENDLIFGLNVGCGIDIRAYSFAYAAPFVNRPTLGCGLVVSDHEAYFLPMECGGKYKR